ncbi:MAG: hypothetical protein WCK03_04200, partial [Candidatus Taylorbacteria bacterium]
TGTLNASHVYATDNTNGWHAHVKITGTGDSGGILTLEGNGTTTPNKHIRAYNGNLEILNSAINAAIVTITDSGNVSTAGYIYNGDWYYGKNANNATQELIRARGTGYSQTAYPGIQIGKTGDHIALFIDPVSIVGGSFNGSTNEIFTPNTFSLLQANSGGSDWIGCMAWNNGVVSFTNKITGSIDNATSATNIYQNTDPASSTFRLLLGNATSAYGAVYNKSALYWNDTGSIIQGANISGNAATATKLNSQGNYSASTPGTTRGSTGLNLYEVYSNGYPLTFGNVIHVSGAGAGQLIIGWSGTDGAHADNYVRSKRDNDAGAWSGWAKLWSDVNLTNLNQLTNGPGYITGYTETDTLATVTSRGASTTSSITVNGDLTVGNTTSSNIFMTDTDNTTRRIHCNSNYIGFLNSANGWGAYCDNTGNWYANNLSGTNTGDVTETLQTVCGRGNTTNTNIEFTNGRKGLVGVYDAAQTQAIFAMGSSYVLTNGGASNVYGSFYGIAWSYDPNYGGAGNNPQSKAGLTHQALFMVNGVTKTAIGEGIWTSGRITGATGSGSAGGFGFDSDTGMTSTGDGNLKFYSNNVYCGGPSVGVNLWDINVTGSAGSATDATHFNNTSLYTSKTNLNTLNSGYSAASDGSDIWINYRGYNDAQAYYRDFRVGNGKGTQIALFTGSTGALAITG